MYEIITKRFRLEDDEKENPVLTNRINLIQKMPGYIEKTFRWGNNELLADYAIRVI